jgi:hypothetical protein
MPGLALILGQNVHQLAMSLGAKRPDQSGAIPMAVPERTPGQMSKIVLLGTTVMLAAATGFAGLAREVAKLGPGVGDILTFDPSRRYTMESGVLMDVKSPEGSGCTLDVSVMQLVGGSLVVEQRGAGSAGFYRVHWAGVRTGEAASDCGTDADLVLSVQDINILASASNGVSTTIVFGSSPR